MKKQKNYDYYQGLAKLASYCQTSAEYLLDSLQNFNGQELAERREKMHDIEHEADMTGHELMHHLAREFLAPMEREDIISLTQQIDNVTDNIEDVLMYIYMCNITSIRPEALTMAKIILTCTQELQKIFADLHNFQKSSVLREGIVEINRLEEVHDAEYIRAMRHLYLNSQDPLEIMIWSETFNCLERCADACEDVADLVETVIMKNS